MIRSSSLFRQLLRAALVASLCASLACTPARQGGAELTPTLPGKDPIGELGGGKPAEHKPEPKRGGNG